MPFLYILENNLGKHYIGITKLDPQKRLLRHNKGDIFSTKLFRPWRIIYTKELFTLTEARIMEKKMKS